jgi:hypothetical protein
VDRGRDHQVLAVLLVAAADIDADDLRDGFRPPRFRRRRPIAFEPYFT